MFWAMLGVVCLGNVVAVRLMRPDSQPSSTFGTVATTLLLSMALIAVVVAPATRGARQGFRRVFAVVTVALAIAVEVVALSYFAAGRGASDLTFGSILSVGVVAMSAAVINLIKRRRA